MTEKGEEGQNIGRDKLIESDSIESGALKERKKSPTFPRLSRVRPSHNNFPLASSYPSDIS